MRRSTGKPAPSAVAARDRAKSAGVCPVYPPPGFTWFEVASTSKAPPCARASSIAASSTKGFAEQTDQMPRGSPRFWSRTMSRSAPDPFIDPPPYPSPRRGRETLLHARLRASSHSSLQPFLQVLGHERVVGDLGVGRGHPVDLLGLPR